MIIRQFSIILFILLPVFSCSNDTGMIDAPAQDINGIIIKNINLVDMKSDKIIKGQLIGPAIFACGPIFFGPVIEPEKKVQEQMDAGFDFIKLYSFLSKKEFYKTITEAKKDGVYTVGLIPFQVGLDGIAPEDYIHAFKQKMEKHQVMFKGGEDFALFKHKLDRLILKYLKYQEAVLVLGSDSGTGGMGIPPGYSKPMKSCAY